MTSHTFRIIVMRVSSVRADCLNWSPCTPFEVRSLISEKRTQEVSVVITLLDVCTVRGLLQRQQAHVHQSKAVEYAVLCWHRQKAAYGQPAVRDVRRVGDVL